MQNAFDGFNYNGNCLLIFGHLPSRTLPLFSSQEPLPARQLCRHRHDLAGHLKLAYLLKVVGKIRVARSTDRAAFHAPINTRSDVKNTHSHLHYPNSSTTKKHIVTPSQTDSKPDTNSLKKNTSLRQNPPGENSLLPRVGLDRISAKKAQDG